MVSQLEIHRFQKQLSKWSCASNRAFFWRNKKATSFQILVCEMLLRKTTANAVDKCVRELFEHLKTCRSFLDIDFLVLQKQLKPLGLYRVRSKAIKDVAHELVENYKGRIPKSFEQLIKLPHVGRYVANATLCFAFEKKRPIVDSNIVRLFHRYFSVSIPVEVHKAEGLWSLAEKVLPQKDFKQFNWKLLDFSRTLCKPRRPCCAMCVLRKDCDYFKGRKNEFRLS